MFKLQADCQVLKACCNEVLVSDSLNAIKIQFAFSDEWEGLEKTAQFTQKNRETNELETYNALIDADGTADLPNEITDGVVLVSVFGVDGDVKRLTTTAVAVPIMKSGFVGDGETPIPPTPDLYQQLVRKVYNTAGSPVIGDNGNWFLDNIDTGVKADWSAEQENAATSAATAEAAAARAEAVKASIPQDYAELSGNVDALVAEIGHAIEKVDVPFTWVNGYFVTQWGSTEAYEGCKIARITDASPYVGKTLRCKSYAFGEMAYIVQSADWAILAKGTSGNDLSSEGNWEFEFTVPEGANWIQVSHSDKYGSDFELYHEEPKSALEEKVAVLADEVAAENPLSVIRKDPGLLSVFLTVGCIGDSLSSGCCVYKDADGVERSVDLYQYSWGQYLARMTGNTYYNFSRGGWSTKDWLNGDLGAALAFDGDHTCDAYIIGLGQNDNNQKIAVGTSADINLADYTRNADSFYGNYGQIIQRIQAIQPRAKIFICTDPLVKADSPETNGYNAAIRQIASMFDNVYLLDLYAHGQELYDYDGANLLSINKRYAHYNAVGYYQCALINATYIDWIMRTHPEEFREVEYIGTDWHYYE